MGTLKYGKPDNQNYTASVSAILSEFKRTTRYSKAVVLPEIPNNLLLNSKSMLSKKTATHPRETINLPLKLKLTVFLWILIDFCFHFILYSFLSLTTLSDSKCQSCVSVGKRKKRWIFDTFEMLSLWVLAQARDDATHIRIHYFGKNFAVQLCRGSLASNQEMSHFFVSKQKAIRNNFLLALLTVSLLRDPFRSFSRSFFTILRSLGESFDLQPTNTRNSPIGC